MFDDRLKAKVAIFHEDGAFKRYKFARKWCKWPKDVAILIYFFIVPFLQTPAWCIDYFRDKDTQYLRPIYECTEVDGGTIRYSELPKLAPFITGSLDFICLGILTFLRYFKMSWREESSKDKCRTYGLAAMFIISILDLCVAIAINKCPYIANYIRPFVVLVFHSTIRANISIMANDLK